jgi:ribonuclease HII
MPQLHDEFPHYDWENNKGYPTKKHRKCIKEFGITDYHRKSFTLLPDNRQSSLFTAEQPASYQLF